MPTICLTMIVKDEGHLIRETLKHLLTYIRFDSWCICDTGSTDNTISEIESFFAEEGIPGSIHRHEWKDFGHNRTLAFEMAYNTSDYAFVWDADDEIVGQFTLPQLTEDWYRFTFGARGCTQYRRCQLFNNRKKWKYVGVLHECPACIEHCGQPYDVLGDYHFVSGRRGARNKDPKKYHKDAMILDKAFEETFAAKDGLYKRYAFYCAQSYVCAGDKEKGIEFYKKVLTFDTWCQEQYIACMEIYDCYEQLGQAKEGLFYLVESFRYDSQRAECVVRLIKYYVNAGLPQVALIYYRGIQQYYENEYAKDAIQEKLFVRRCDPDFYLPYYMIIVAERTRNLDLCAKMFTAILTYKYMGVSAWWIQNTFHNLQFFLDHIPKTMEYLQFVLDYVELVRSKGICLQDAQNAVLQRYIRSCDSLLTSVLSSSRNIIPKKCRVRVMLTITTCKRFDLFQKTVRSMLATWTDIEEVDYFFCVDDASSKEHREAMIQQFPFFTYYMKTEEEKGHRESMNIIWNKLHEVKPDYWIHLEDDWLFFRRKAYVKESIALLTKYESQDIHQVVFNRNYGVIYQDLDRVGGIDLGDAILHEKREGLVGKNCGYWPHYSLQPSMVRTRVILELGDYSSERVFFEQDYARKYFAAGYKTIFFPMIYSNHIGKQHWEKEGMNAYALNTTNQFGTVAPAKEVSLGTQENLPLQGTMLDHLKTILEKIQSRTPFGLIRPSDGERIVLLNQEITNCDHWTFREGGSLQKDLLQAIQTVNPNLYIGIPCNTCKLPWNCTEEIYSDFVDRFRVPLAQRTYANIFGNSNWTTFAQFIKGYSRGFFCITSGSLTCELPVKEVFRIHDKLVNSWDEQGASVTQRLLAFVKRKRGELFLFSAGPLSKVWIPLCMAENPTNMYVDVGGALDIYTKGVSSRFYTREDHPFAKQWCMFNDT